MTMAAAKISLLTVAEAADLLRLSPATVYDKVEAGELAVVRLVQGPRPRIRIEADELRRYIREGRGIPVAGKGSGGGAIAGARPGDGARVRLALFETRVHALAIAAFVRKRGAAYSGEILDEFLISQATLRRRRPELLHLGLVFVERGRGSFYATAELARHLPTTYQAEHAFVGAVTEAIPDSARSDP